MKARAVTFWVEKDGSSAAEYEDAACCAEDPAAGHNPRFVLVDGATEAFDAVRWVGQLVTSFVGDDRRNGQARTPGLDPASLQDWFAHMQKRWLADAPAQFGNVIEEIKFHQVGSFATLLGCELVDLGGAAPHWYAVSLGDTVLFHVRDGGYRSHFPPLTIEDFGVNPPGVHTKPEALDQMMAALQSAHGDLRVGDRLYLATDALALWLLQNPADSRLWHTLGGILHDSAFRRLVLDRRASGELNNDDTTLVRIQIVDAEPRFLAVCL